MIAYFDTSAFVKLLVDEPGSERAAATWRRADAVVTSLLMYAEARAAIAQGVRTGRFSARTERGAVASLTSLVDAVDFVRPTRDVVWSAGDLARDHSLRGYDAVHLASALRVGSETVLVTADHRLAQAGDAAGLAVDVPA